MAPMFKNNILIIYKKKKRERERKCTQIIFLICTYETYGWMQKKKWK